MSILFNENPLTVNTELARAIGLNESIVLQQLQYWLRINKKANRNYKDGLYWTYNTFEEWQEQFPFWSLSTIKRIFAKLEKEKYIITGNYNKLKIDRTKWYTINYKVVETLEESPKCQNDLMDVSICADGLGQYDTTITRDYPKTTTKTNNIYITLASDDNDPFLIFYLSAYKNHFNKSHMRVTPEQLDYIESAINEIKGYGVELDTWQEEVNNHFDSLPDNNNGNILAFLKASFRYFEIHLDYVI